MNEQLKELYTNLSQKGIGVGDEIAFEAAYNTEEGFKEIFDASKQLGIVPADWDDNAFKSTFPQTTQPEEPSGFRRFISGAREALRSAHEANKEEIRKANGIQTATTGELDRRLIEEAAEAAELVRQEKIATGLTNQDKKDMEELAQLQEQASNPVSVEANGVFSVAMQEPVLNQYGFPTNITKPVNQELENKIEAKKAQMPSYLTRGEENFESIQINAIERALGTEDGKRLQTIIYNKYAEEFKNSDAYKTMMKDFYAGKVTEDDILSLFTESYGSKINGEFYNEIAREGGLMHEYIKDAEKKLNTRLSAEDAYGLQNEIEIAKAEQEQQYTAEYNEKYKQTFGVYPDDDPLRTIHQKGFSASGISPTYIEKGNLAQALQFNDKALDLISAVNNNKGFFGGLGDAVTDIDTWDLGISEIARTKSLMDIIDKVTDDKELTKDEQLMFDAALNYFAVSTYYSNKVGRGYKAGQTTGASLPFMIQFVVSSGATAAIDGALKSGASAVTKKIVKAMIKGGMKKTAKAVSSDAATMVGKAIGGAVVSGIDAALLTSTFGIGKIEAGTLQRELGHVITDFDSQTNKLEYKGVEGAQTREEARRNAIIDTYVEYFSEMALANTLSPVASYLGGTKLFKDIAKGDIAGTIIDIWNNPAWKSIRQSTKFGSLPEEVFEEELGGLLRLSASDVNSIKEAGLDLDSQIDIVLGLAPTSIFFGGVGTVSHYGTLWSSKREFRASLTTEEEKQLFDRLMSESRSGEFGELAHNLIRTIVQDTQMSQEAKKRSISSIVAEYHDLLSKETQELADQITVSGNERIIDDYISQARYGASDNIYQTKDNKGRVLVISDGKIKLSQVRVGQAYYLVADPSKSEGKVKVRYVNNNGTLTDEIEINVADLTAPVTKLGVNEFKKFKLAQSNASSSEQEAFEFEGGMYNTSTGEYIDTKEEYEKKKAEAEANEAPTVETKAHKVNETVTITINGEKKTVKIISNNLTQNEDGSIKGGTISISVDGSPITGERKKAIISQISELFKKEHAKAIEDFNKRKEEANTPVEPTPIVSEEDKSIADIESQKEAERQTILASAQQKKAKKYTPEETVVVLMEQGNDVATRLVGSRINKLHAQIDEINADENKDELEKWEDSKELSDQLAEYEAAVVKWLGQEALDAIDVARVTSVAPVVEPASVEEAPVVPPTQEAAVEIVEEPTNPDTTPLPLPEQEVEGTEVTEDETPAPETLGEETVPEVEQEIAGNESIESEPVVEKPTANLDEVTVWVAKNYDYIVTDKEGNTIFSSKPTRKKVTDAFEELHQVEGKVDGKRGTYNGEDCIIVRDNPSKGYVNIVTPHGIERVGREEVMVDGKPLKGKASIVEWRENNEKIYGTFESIISFPVFDIRGEMNITFLDFLNTQQDSPYVAFYEMLRKHYREKYNDDVAQQYLDAGVSRLIENLKEVARLWNIVRLKNLVSSGQMPTALDKKKMESQSKRIKEAVAAVHNEVGLDNSIDFSGLAELAEKAAKKAEKKGEGEGYFAETDEEKAESYVDGLVSNIVWIGFETENKHEHEDAVDGIIEALNKESKKASKQRELVVNILNDRLEEAKRLNRLNDIQAIERVIDRLSSLKKFKPLLTVAGLIEEKRKKAPVKPAPKKDTSKLVEQLSLEENSIRDMEEEYKTTTDAEEKSELEGYIAQAKEKIAKLKAEIDGAEFMVGDVVESSASQEAKELTLAAEIQSLADSEEIEVLNVTQEQAEEARITGKPEMQVSNETQRIFVSNAERAVESIKQDKATPQQWKAMIEKQGGLKAGEDKWLSLSEWLDNQDKKTLTKQEILDYIAEHQIHIEDVAYGGEQVNVINRTRLRYATKGLKNNREIALTVPTIDSYNETDDLHFGDAGDGRAVAWIRFGETTDESGNRVLVIDEIQSKRHQDGREKGYSNTELRKKIEEAERKIANIYAKSANDVQRIDELISEIKELRKDNEEKEDAERYELARLREEQNNVRNNRDYDRLQAEIDEISETQLKRLNHISRLNTELRLLQDRALDSASSDEMFDLRMEIQNYELELLNKVPDAPFDKNWHELAFKRMLRYAAENGYDYVAWTTGVQQAERYDLGHTVSRIVSANKKNSSKDIDIEFANGGGVTLRVNSEGVITSGEFSGKTLSDVVGKDIADKIINNEGDDVMFETSYGEIPAKELKGENLSIGGEGMKGFYDKMLPSFVSKYTKKWGAKVQDINLPELEASAQTMHAVNVTPEMKESVMQGQPMFSIESTPLMTSNGAIYGYALGNKIYLTPDGMNTNTPVHEYTHIWAKAMQKHNPKAWKSIVEQLKKAEALWNEVVNDPNYENIKNDEDAIASEVLSRYSGKNGAAKLEAEAERVVTEYKGMEKDIKVKALINRVKKALNQFWSWVGKDLFKIESFESVESIADRVLYDMLNNTQLNLDNSKKSSTFAQNNENYERTDEFRELQERSLGLSLSRISEFHSGERKLSDEDRRRVGGVFQRLMESERNGGRNGQWINLTGKGNQFKIAQVNPAIFHDIFQICRNYLPNGELVDLHDNYADCKCFISDDGLCGFAIEPNGNLISVFSLNPSDKKGFLYAIKDIIRQEGATHLDCYVSSKQPLDGIYQKALGFHVASEMDYNMEYDHDNIAENHGMPKVAFMVDKPTEKREFDGESYDAAYDYQQSQTSTAEREQIVAEAKANGTYMLAPNGQPTNLTEDQWVATRTQAFKDYFGDWQNDPANASVVVDENGEPMVVYHGSRMAGFDKFGRGEARDSQGIYTTPNRRAAESYATSVDEWRSEQTMPEAELGVPDHHGVYSLFVNMRNPKVIDFGGNRFDRYGTPQYEVATNEVLDNGGRGILFDTLEEAKAYMAAHPEEDLDYVEKYTTSDDMLVQAKEEGYDGVIFTNIIDSRYQDPITNYVPFESNQVKSATQNIGTFNPQDDRIEFMIGPNPSSSTPTDPTVFDTEAANRLIVKTQKYLAKVANPNVELPEEFSSWKKMVAEAFDRTEGVRWMMNSIEKYRREHGLPELGEGFDVRTMVETMESKVQNETQSYIRNIENRLRDNIRKLAKRLEGTSFYKQYKTEKIKNQSGEDVILTPVQMIERYLIARDSIEREELTGKPRGAADFYQRMGVDMVEFVKAFHSALFSTAEKKKELDELWESIRAATDVVIDRGWESGLISYDEYQDYKKRKFYVPERDFAEVEANEDIAVEELSYHGRGSNKLAAMKQAKGGESLAANVLANICLLARDAILKANRNKVKKSMYDLLRANTDWCREYHIPIPHQIWYVKNPDGSVTRMTDGPTAEQKQQMREIKSDIRKIEDEIRNLTALRDAATVPSIKDAYDADIQDLKEQVDMLRDMMPYLDEYDTRNQIFLDGAAKNASTVVVYVDGVPTEMLFPNMTIVANALNGTFNKEGEWSWAKNSTNIAASAMTVYNPTFFTVNVVRDIPFIATKGFVEYGFTFPFRFAIELGKKLLTRDLWKVVWTGDASSISNEHLKAFYEGGANTGYSSLPDLKKLKDATKGWGKGTTVTWSNVGDVLSYLNTFSEVWTRAAAYSAVRQMGNSNEEGIRAAKNLSVNFNRKGLGNRFMNAFGSISLFMNAAIQGSCGWMRAFSGNEKTFAAKAWHATRAALGFMLAPAFAGFIDTLCNPDDDENLLWYSDYDRDNYLIMGDRRIPLNEQLKPFWVVGVNIALGMQGRRSTEQIINSIVSSVFTNFVPLPPVINESIVMAVNGATGTKDVDLFDIPANLITPQAIGGVYDLANGVNFMGSKLEFDTGDKPQFIFSENEALTSRLLAKMLYYLGGGSKDVKSKTRDNGKDILFDINPKQITALRSLLPVGSTFKDITEFMLRGIVEKDFGSPEDYTTIRRFYKPREEEIAMYNIIKEAKAIVKRNSEIKANMKSQLKGGELSSNEAMSSEAGRRLEAALTDTEIKEIEAYIKAYEVYSVARRAREFGLTEEEFLNSLPDETKKQIKDIDSRRPEIARKLLTMTREYKGMKVKNMTWKQGLGIE